jgi:hypothetical protein
MRWYVSSRFCGCGGSCVAGYRLSGKNAYLQYEIRIYLERVTSHSRGSRSAPPADTPSAVSLTVGGWSEHPSPGGTPGVRCATPGYGM